MRDYQRIFLYLLLLMFTIGQMSFAQVRGIKGKDIELDNTDSLKNGQDTIEELFILKAVKFDLENIFDTIPFSDTLLTEDFPYFNIIDSKKYPVIDKGYIGSATMPIEGYQRSAGFDLGYHQFDIYRRNNNTFHITNGAIANLYFSPGADVDQFSTGAMFTKNFKDVSLNIDYSRVKNTGKYSGQNIKHTYLNFGIWHGNLNSTFNTFLNFRVYANEEYDNGGLENLEDLKEEYFSIRQQVPTKLTDAISRNDNYGLTLTEYMKLPVKISYFQPYLIAKLRMSKEFYKFTDKDVNEDSIYGKLLTDEAGLRHYREVKRFGTDVSLFARLKGKSYLKAGLAFDKINLDTEPAVRESINELAFVTSGNINFAKSLGLKWNSKFLFGQYTGNTESNVSLNYKIGLFSINTGVEYGNYAPAIIHKQLYITGKEVYTNDFDNTQKFTFFARLNIDKIGLSVQNKWQTIDKYIYFSSDLMPSQLNESLNVNILNVEERLKLGIFRFDANLYYNTSSSIKLPMPQYTAQLKLYLEGKPKFVRGDLLLSSGFEFNYWDKFYNYSFNPAIGNYYVQNDLKLDNYKRLDFFFAAKVHDFRLFARINNVLFPLTKEVPFKVTNYPQSDLFWRLGVRWVFLN